MIIKRLFLLFSYCCFIVNGECIPADLEERSAFLRTINGHTLDYRETKEMVKGFLTQPSVPSDDFCLSVHTFVSGFILDSNTPFGHSDNFSSFIQIITGVSYEDFQDIQSYVKRFSEEYGLNGGGEVTPYRDIDDLWTITNALASVRGDCQDQEEFRHHMQPLVDLFEQPENLETPQGEKLICISRHSDIIEVLGNTIPVRDWSHKVPHFGALMRKWPNSHECGEEPIISILAQLEPSCDVGAFVQGVLKLTQGAQDLEGTEALSRMGNIYMAQEGAESWERLIAGVEHIFPETLDLSEEESVLDRVQVLEGLHSLGNPSHLSAFLENFLPFLTPDMNSQIRASLFEKIYNFDFDRVSQCPSGRFFYLDVLGAFLYPDVRPEEKYFFLRNIDIWARDSGQDIFAFHKFYRHLKKSKDPLVVSDENLKKLYVLLKLSSPELHAFLGLFPKEMEGEDLEAMLETINPQGIFHKRNSQESKEDLILVLKAIEEPQRVRFIKSLRRLTKGVSSNSAIYNMAQYLQEQPSASWEALSTSFEVFLGDDPSLTGALRMDVIQKLGTLSAPYRQQLLEGIQPFLVGMNASEKISVFRGFHKLSPNMLPEAIACAQKTLDLSWSLENEIFFLLNIKTFAEHQNITKLLPYIQKTENFLFRNQKNQAILNKFANLSLKSQKSFLTFFTSDMTPGNLLSILNLLTKEIPLDELDLITKRAEFQVRHLTSLNRRIESIQKTFDEVKGIESLNMILIKAAGPEPLADLTDTPMALAKGFKSLTDQINITKPDQRNYLHVSAIEEGPSKSPEESAAIMERVIKRFLSVMEVMEGKKERPNSNVFWEPHAEDKLLILNALKHILNALQIKGQENFEEALPYLGILIRAFHYCPAAQAEGVESVVNALIYGENCGATELPVLLKKSVVQGVHKALVNEFFEGEHEQNSHQLSMARDALRDHLPARVLSTFSDKIYPVTPDDSKKIRDRFALALTEDVLIQEVRAFILPPEYYSWQKEREDLERNRNDEKKLQEIKRRQEICLKEHPVTVTDIAAWLLTQDKEPNNMEKGDYGFADYGIDSDHTTISDEGIRLLLIDFGYIRSEQRSAEFFEDTQDSKKPKLEVSA